ncbi:hypothetical protein niasHS_002287 [Heterodera schachtii]|uniref:T-box domain-containing protein n=1 Tax=Heterodera schachtii TaxID=97005 RepID=A0ABD2KJL2_HETSC
MDGRERKKRPLPFSIECLLSAPCQKKPSLFPPNISSSPPPSLPCSSSSSSSAASPSVLHHALQSAQIRLEGASLWRRFHALGTEMIVTRSGRRMFPTLQVAIVRLERNLIYSLMVDFQRTDRKRYRYSFHQSKWVVAGPGEAEFPARMHVHPDSPALGDHWMRLQVVCFDKVKLTNNLLDQNGHAIVNSMHRYQPRFHLVVHPSPAESNAPKNWLKRRIFAFPETTFMAVTAYQNHRALIKNRWGSNWRRQRALPNGRRRMGANQMGANQMGASQMGANQMGASQMGASQMGANQMGANPPFLSLQLYFFEQ